MVAACPFIVADTYHLIIPTPFSPSLVEDLFPLSGHDKASGFFFFFLHKRSVYLCISETTAVSFPQELLVS